MICCLMEATKATPYRQAWQERPNYELRGDGISVQVILIKGSIVRERIVQYDSGLNLFCCN